MAVLQYIGARYVPKFVGEYDATLSYEPLTIVQYGNNTYTSKIPVPVGILPTNTEYWALTGNYNGALQELQEDMQKLSVKAGAFTRPEEFGAVGDGETDDTVAVDTCLRYAIDHNLMVILTGWYKIGQIDLRDVGQRIFNLHIEGATSGYAAALYDPSKLIGFNSYASGAAFVFPYMNMTVLKDFTIDCPQSVYAFEFYGGLYVYIDHVSFGYHCSGIHIHTGGYWTITNCCFNTRVPHTDTNLHFLNIDNEEREGSARISASEYYFLENCAIANDRSMGFSDLQSAVITKANNYTVFHHCDFIAWGAAYEFVDSFGNSKNVKFMECNIGCKHIIKNAQPNSVHGINGLLIKNCNIGVTGSYFRWENGAHPSMYRVNFSGNTIDLLPVLDSGETCLMPMNNTKTDWWIQENMLILSAADQANFPKYTDVNITASIQGIPHIQDIKSFTNNQTAAAISAGISITVPLNVAMINPVPVRVSSYAVNYNTKHVEQLDVSNIVINDDNSITFNVSKTGLSGNHNIVSYVSI